MKKKELLKLFVSKGLISLITIGIFSTFNPSMAFAETGDIDWQKCLGGSGTDVELQYNRQLTEVIL